MKSEKTLFFSATTLCLLALGIFACSDMGVSRHQALAEGEIVHVGKKNFTMKDQQHFIFVNLDTTNTMLTQQLKKGDHVALYGKQSADMKGSSEIDEVVLADGTHINLQQ